jgi:ankyrin repeat protein
VASHCQQLFQTLGIDLNALDNYGYNARDQWERWIRELPRDSGSVRLESEVQLILALHCNSLNRNISFGQAFTSKSWKASTWLEWLTKSRLISWISINGDTPLTTVLKKWRAEEEELQLKDTVRELFHLGADVNMRDRKEHSALAIATIRGSRPSVEVLLESGAMRNYRGEGIISQALAQIRLAKREGKDSCYARILSCINLLVEHGAKSEPTEHNEWLLPAVVVASGVV